MARDNARQVREQLSTEVWEHLNRLYLRLQPVTMDAIWVHQPARLFRETLEELHTLEGVTYSTLSHGEGWYFLELGRHIERAQLVSRLLDLHFGAAADGGYVAAKIFRLAGAAEILHGLRALLQSLHRRDPAREDRRVPAVRRGVSPFRALFGRPHVRCAGACCAGRAAARAAPRASGWPGG